MCVCEKERDVKRFVIRQLINTHKSSPQNLTKRNTHTPTSRAPLGGEVAELNGSQHTQQEGVLLRRLRCGHVFPVARTGANALRVLELLAKTPNRAVTHDKREKRRRRRWRERWRWRKIGSGFERRREIGFCAGSFLNVH